MHEKKSGQDITPKKEKKKKKAATVQNSEKKKTKKKKRKGLTKRKHSLCESIHTFIYRDSL